MGRLEKIVVLTVLFLVAVILAISLNSGSSTAKTPVADGGKPVGPRGRHVGAEAEAVDPSNVVADASGAKRSDGAVAQPTGALNSQVTPNAAPAQTPPANANPAPSAATPPVNPQPAPSSEYLKTRDGLTPTSNEEWMTYTWKAGDTFTALSERYYGSKLYVSRLKSANEGKDETKLAPGESILVSVSPSAAIDRATVAKTTKDDANKPADAATTKWSGGPYVVKAGDVLGTIAQQVYGTSKKWKKIYDANRDVLGDSPNSLKVGMKLRIPE
jgi:nucleoid-associated protein YgaU